MFLADQKSGARVQNCFIGGFNYAINSGLNNTPKVKVIDVGIDCRNGIRINKSFDVSYVTRVHCWPFLSIGFPNRTEEDVQRDGVAFANLGGDATKFTDCFSYGYRVGYQITDTNNAILTNCGADNNPNGTLHASSFGFYLDGETKEPLLTNCQSAGQSAAGIVSILGDVAGYLQLNNCSFWRSAVYQAYIISGEYLISNSSFRGVLGAPETEGLRIESTSKGIVEGNIFSGLFTAVSSTETAVPLIGTNIIKDCANGYNRRDIESVASESTVFLNQERGVFKVTGVSTISNIQNVLAYAGEKITLIFDSTASVNNLGNVKLSSSPFSATSGDTLTLVSDGLSWYEVSRSVNI
ncbi:tail fiber protein [Alteromonas phage XX1924]|nr:tail fiber protein [Alteromonas phage XX1924]